jgi:hypothetical protein
MRVLSFELEVSFAFNIRSSMRVFVCVRACHNSVDSQSMKF